MIARGTAGIMVDIVLEEAAGIGLAVHGKGKPGRGRGCA
jgi:hypothetical protein